MPRLACAACGTVLTADCTWGAESDLAEEAAREARVPAGLFIRLPEDSVALEQDGRQVGTHIFSPEGAIAANPADVVVAALRSSGYDNGCCGSDGHDGPNRSCACGQVLATQFSDCWTLAEVRFLPDAVVEAVQAATTRAGS